MRVKIEEIREKGLDLNETVASAQVQKALEGTEFKAAGEVPFKAHLEKVGSGVILKGRFTAQVTAPCRKCVNDVQLSLPSEFTLNLVPANLARDLLGEDAEGEDDDKAERGGSFSLDQAEQDTFDGKVIELDPIFREQLLLALPMFVTCKEDCKGLCTVCGQNLNERACGCDTRQVDPRLAALKNIKLN